MWPLRTRPGWKPQPAPIIAIGLALTIITICAIRDAQLGVALALLTVPMWISLLLIRRGGR